MSRDALITRLARLDDQDRAWLLGELSPRMRNDLLGMLSEEQEPAPVAKPEVPTGFESVEPELLARLMSGEPAWLVSAATRATEPRWRARLLQAMPSRRRHEIELSDRTGGQLCAQAAQLVLAQCRARATEPAAQISSESRSRFADLVDSMRSRFA